LIRSNSTCVSTCSYPNLAYNGVCDLCIAPCSSCVSANSTNPTLPGNITVCKACILGYYFYSNNCYVTCPYNNTFANSSSTCSSCSPSCLRCFLTASSCTACYTGSYLLPNNTCSTSCPPSTYTYAGLCVACKPECAGCTTGGAADECTVCISPTSYYFNSITYKCTLSCTAPYYANNATPLACRPC
jgi:proprotein convertase subtilisin/kexin type 5